MIYRFEIKRQLMNALVWAFVILAVFMLLVYGFYPVFLDCRPILEEYIASFPPGIAKAFGFDLDDLFGFESYSGMVYLYVSVLGAIMISSAAISVFAREKKEKCRDFLMTKPVRRGVVFGKKLLYTTKGRSRKFGSARWGRNVYRIFLICLSRIKGFLLKSR